jgi:hypothetical protein
MPPERLAAAPHEHIPITSPYHLASADFGKFIAPEIPKWTRVVKKANIKVELTRRTSRGW